MANSLPLTFISRASWQIAHGPQQHVIKQSPHAPSSKPYFSLNCSRLTVWIKQQQPNKLIKLYWQQWVKHDEWLSIFAAFSPYKQHQQQHP